MAGMSDAAEADYLKLVYNATPIANVADNAASSPLGSLYVALHTADPGDTGNQSTSEVAYTSYARVAVARTTGGFTVSGTSPTTATNVADINFPAGTGGSGTATYFSVGYGASGATKIERSGALSPSIVTGNGITPKIPAGSLTLTAD